MFIDPGLTIYIIDKERERERERWKVDSLMDKPFGFAARTHAVAEDIHASNEISRSQLPVVDPGGACSNNGNFPPAKRFQIRQEKPGLT